MVKSKFKAGAAVLALCGLVAAGPVLAAAASPILTAAAAMRSVQALPLLGASVGSVPYATGAENTWRCASVTDEALKLDNKPVNVDEAGRVVVDPKGAPFACKSPVNNFKVATGGGGFPIEILGGILGAGGLIIVAAGGGSSNDSPG